MLFKISRIIVRATKAIILHGILETLSLLYATLCGAQAPRLHLSEVAHLYPQTRLNLLATEQRDLKMKNVMIYVIRLYQFFSSFTPPCCRFTPSCSHYTVQAIEHHGVFHGSWLGLKRLCRCHPLTQGGFDPPPPARVKLAS